MGLGVYPEAVEGIQLRIRHNGADRKHLPVPNAASTFGFVVVVVVNTHHLARRAGAIEVQ
jgi:hypothetical protein